METVVFNEEEQSAILTFKDHKGMTACAYCSITIRNEHLIKLNKSIVASCNVIFIWNFSPVSCSENHEEETSH